MAELPVKAVEMLMDKSIYKLGVQIRGEFVCCAGACERRLTL